MVVNLILVEIPRNPKESLWQHFFRPCWEIWLDHKYKYKMGPNTNTSTSLQRSFDHDGKCNLAGALLLHHKWKRNVGKNLITNHSWTRNILRHPKTVNTWLLNVETYSPDSVLIFLTGNSARDILVTNSVSASPRFHVLPSFLWRVK